MCTCKTYSSGIAGNQWIFIREKGGEARGLPGWSAGRAWCGSAPPASHTLLWWPRIAPKPTFASMRSTFDVCSSGLSLLLRKPFCAAIISGHVEPFEWLGSFERIGSAGICAKTLIQSGRNPESSPAPDPPYSTQRSEGGLVIVWQSEGNRDSVPREQFLNSLQQSIGGSDDCSWQKSIMTTRGNNYISIYLCKM